MLKSKSKIFLILFIAVMLITTAVFATEATPTSEESGDAIEGALTTGEGTEGSTSEQIESSDRYLTGDNIEISTLIDGNVFAVGKEVTLTGQIGGDLFVIADKLNIVYGSAIYGNIFAIASEIVIDGQMYDIYAACDNMKIEYNGYVYRDLRVMATEVSIAGIVRRNAFIEADKVTLETDCVIPGDLVYTAQSDAIYKESVKSDNDEVTTNETTTIPKTVVEGETKFTQRSKNVYAKENAIKARVESIIKNNKINNDTSEEKLKAVLIANTMNLAGISNNASVVNNENTKDISKTYQIPALYVYIAIAVMAVLVIVVIVLLITKGKTKKVKDKVETKTE